MAEENPRGLAKGVEMQEDEWKLEKKKRVIIRFEVCYMLCFIC